MDTQLSLESIKACLLVELEQKELDCIKMIIDPKTESFLEREKNNQKNDVDRLSQKLAEEKKSLEEFLDSIISEDAAKTKLTEAAGRLEVKQKEYEKASSNAHEAGEAYDSQSKHVSDLEAKLKETEDAIAKLCNCKNKRVLENKKKEQEKNLKQEKEKLSEHESDKATKESLKDQASTELEHETALKAQAENELKTVQEDHQKIQIYETQLGSVQQGFDNIEDMLKKLSSQADELEKNSEEMYLDIDVGNPVETTIFNGPIPEQQYEL